MAVNGSSEPISKLIFNDNTKQAKEMKNKKLFSHTPIYLGIYLLLFIWGCERSVSGLEEAPNPDNPNVFIDTFSSGLNYAAFEGSVLEAFLVVEDETYDNSIASMRFEVPDFGDPRGSFAGGAFFTSAPRNLTEYNALTFYAKASETTQIGVLGIGLDLGENKFQASVENTRVITTWQKYIIPIPDPSLLDAEQGMLFYSSGPIDGEGYTFWLDEVKFENLGSIAFDSSEILNGEERELNGQNGQTFTIDGLASLHRLPDGTVGEVTPSPFYFNFSSSDESVAQVAEDGTVTVTGEGTAVITATLQGESAKGLLTVNSTGEASTPDASAPIPTSDEENVLSLFSDEYTDVPVDTWRTEWSVAELEDIDLLGNPTKKYTSLDFVGIETTGQNLVDASAMEFMHIDLWTPNMEVIRIKLVDFGADGEFNGGDDSEFELVFEDLQTQQWNSLKIPLTDFEGLQTRENLAQLILSGLPAGSSTLYVDNVYFSKDSEAQATEPVNAAPAPAADEADVISIFSDSYENVEGTNLNPDWGQATVTTEVLIEDNNTLRLEGLDYQGIELGSNLDVSDMETVHIDFWTANSAALSVFLISPGPTEESYVLSVPTTGWASVEISLSEFNSVDLSDVFQFKFEGDGDVWIDNIYFEK